MVGKQFPPWTEGDDVWGVQNIMHPELGKPIFAEWYGSDDLLDVSAALMGVERKDMQFGGYLRKHGDAVLVCAGLAPALLGQATRRPRAAALLTSPPQSSSTSSSTPWRRTTPSPGTATTSRRPPRPRRRRKRSRSSTTASSGTLRCTTTRVCPPCPRRTAAFARPRSARRTSRVGTCLARRTLT